MHEFVTGKVQDTDDQEDGNDAEDMAEGVTDRHNPYYTRIIMIMIVCILGRQPRLGLAELESLYGAEKIKVVAGGTVALVDVPSIDRELGGTIKVAKLLDALETTTFDKLSQSLAKRMSKYLAELSIEGKVKFGLSVYGVKTNIGELNRASLFLKKRIKNAGRSVRVVPNNELYLNSAQVLHNQLTSRVGLELLLIRDGDKTFIARTIHEQDIDAYTLRDRGRPKRDAFVGMLPPKLAQIMIHLAHGHASLKKNDNVMLAAAELVEVSETSAFPAGARQDKDNQLAPSGVDESSADSDAGTLRLLDPFCGTGVVLQEAALEGYAVYGADLSQKMVEFTTTNLKWLAETHKVDIDATIEQGDATTHQWKGQIDTVVCEGYLGQPMSQEPPREKLEMIMHECNSIMRDFLKNIAPQLPSGTPLCVAVPAWHLSDGFKHLKMVDQLDELGFSRREFIHARESDLLYYREDQIVARELLVLTKD